MLTLRNSNRGWSCNQQLISVQYPLPDVEGGYMKKIQLWYPKAILALIAALLLTACGISYKSAAYSEGKTELKGQVAKLPDSLAVFLKDSSYVASADSYEAALRSFDKEEYDFEVKYINNIFDLYTYGHGWYGFGWYAPYWLNPFYNPFWDPDYQGNFKHTGAFIYDMWRISPFYAYGPMTHPWYGPVHSRNAYRSINLRRSRNIGSSIAAQQGISRTRGTSYAQSIAKSRNNDRENLYASKLGIKNDNDRSRSERTYTKTDGGRRAVKSASANRQNNYVRGSSSNSFNRSNSYSIDRQPAPSVVMHPATPSTGGSASGSKVSPASHK